MADQGGDFFRSVRDASSFGFLDILKGSRRNLVEDIVIIILPRTLDMLYLERWIANNRNGKGRAVGENRISADERLFASRRLWRLGKKGEHGGKKFRNNKSKTDRRKTLQVDFRHLGGETDRWCENEGNNKGSTGVQEKDLLRSHKQKRKREERRRGERKNKRYKKRGERRKEKKEEKRKEKICDDRGKNTRNRKTRTYKIEKKNTKLEIYLSTKTIPLRIGEDTLLTASIVASTSSLFTTVQPGGNRAIAGANAMGSVVGKLLEEEGGKAINRIVGTMAVVNTAEKHVLGGVAVGLRNGVSLGRVARLLVRDSVFLRQRLHCDDDG